MINELSVNQQLNVDKQNLKIGTLNIRGFKNNLKKEALLSFLNETNLDIIALQETHLSHKDYASFKWNGSVIYSEGTNHSLGLSILFNKSINSNNIKKIFSDERILLCSYKIGQELFLPLQHLCTKRQ